jgi:ArsR family transcriptional regulator, arsenate/arsenite/antimonite-responsive transcriptional repressor / arsenate reductase (thioredoxin)
VEVESAGVRPGTIHPLAVEAMHARGIDIATQRSKHLDVIGDQTFDRVITVCDQMREQCPAFPGHPDCIHWSLEDPIRAAELAGSQSEQSAIFSRTAQELETRIRFLLLAETG